MASHNPPIYSQDSLALCWEACARMMWGWKHQGLARYRTKAGAWATRRTGLTELQMDKFYRTLGMRSLGSPNIANVHHALHFSPVIFTIIGGQAGHAMLATGDEGGMLQVVNPCAVQSVNFGGGADSCEAGAGNLAPGAVDKALGSLIWYW
ncbi:MAG: papain-like cysteine protease family protein [Myxococcota bacterium]